MNNKDEDFSSILEPENNDDSPGIKLDITDIEKQYESNDKSDNLNRELYNKELLQEFYDINEKLSENLLTNIIFNHKNQEFLNKKLNLIEHIQVKINKLIQKLRLIELKNNKYKFCYNVVNISIIIMSTLLTVIEAVKGIMIDDLIDEKDTLAYIFKMSPLIFSSTITCSASILKFKKYQEKMEIICRAIENGSNSVTSLKKIREELTFIKTEAEYKNLCSKFNNELYEQYISTIQYIDRILKKKDYDVYLKNIYQTDYRLHTLQKEKEFFLTNYVGNHSIDKILAYMEKDKNPKKSCI